MDGSGRFANRTFFYCALVLVLLAGVLALRQEQILPVRYLHQQDLPAIGAILLAFLAVRLWRPAVDLSRARLGSKQVVAIAVLLALALWAGTYWVMFDYALTRDEHMAVFDAGIFARGTLSEPLAEEWRGYSLALVPAFLLDVPGNAVLVSGYMPGNAMMRAVFEALGDDALLNPVLTGLGLVAIYDIARRLFPDTPGAVVVAMAGYVLSAQVLVNAMTTYAMTGHLALNLIWLALFLHGKWWQHALAMVVGAWAMGLHQVVFHPLFAGPFILMLLPRRQWMLFGAYALAYAAALLFWLAYPSIVVASTGVVVEAGSSTGGIVAFVYERIVPLLTERDPGGMTFMQFNLVRFAAWSPAFLIPFAALAWPYVRENRGMALPLFGGIALTLMAMIVLLPYQGHGWGYRYWHGLLGNFALLAGYGYARWAERERAQADGGFAVLAGMTALVILPFLLWSTYAFTRPYSVLSERIAAQDSDFIIVDTDTTRAAIDQVRNRADLSNRPLVFSSRELAPGQAAELCRRGSVTAIGAETFRATGFFPDITGKEGERFAAMREVLGGGGCLRPVK